MLSVSSMALATVSGSACGINMANINDCSAALYNTGNCPQAVRCQKSGQDLSSALSQMGASMMPRNSQCGVN